MATKWMRRAAIGAALATAALITGASAGFADAPLSTATAGDGAANGTAAGIPGTITVSESNAARGNNESPDSASWSLLSLGGMSLLGHENNDDWAGALAPAGALVDAVNDALCPAGGTVTPLGSGYAVTCIAVVLGTASANNDGPPIAFG